MASPRPRLHSLISYALDKLFTTRPPVIDDGDAADAFPTRHEQLNQGILDVGKAFGQDIHVGCLRESHMELGAPWFGDSVFIVDSGATAHATGDRAVFSSLSLLVGAVTTPAAESSTATATYYQACGGTRLAVAGIGTISRGNFHLPNVLYVPGLGTGGAIHVSVHQLAELGYLVTFGDGQCSVKDRRSGKLVGKGRLHDDVALYHLKLLKIPT